MYCSKCGNKSPAGARFCQKCGAKAVNNISETVNLLNHPASLAELGGGGDSYTSHGQEQAPHATGYEHDISAAKREGSAGFMSYNIAPKRNVETKSKTTGYNKQRPHMAAPIPSAEMDYTFYPGQTAELDPDDPAPKNANGSDPMEYPIAPTFPKPAKPSLRAIADTSHTRVNPQVAPGAPASKPHSANVTEFAGYQILPAAYKPTQQRTTPEYNDRIPVQHIELPQQQPVVPEPPMPTSPVQPQPEFAHAPEIQPLPVHAQPIPTHAQPVPIAPQPVPAPPQPMNIPPQSAPVLPQQPTIIPPQPVPIPPQQPTIILPQAVQTPPQQPMNIPPQPVNPPPQPVYTHPQKEYPPQQEMWQTYNEPDDMITHMPEKKSKLPAILCVIVVLAIAGAAIFFFVNRMGNVNPDRMVGTWEQSPPLGTWIPRLEFNADGTGQFYQFNGYLNVSRGEREFTWSIVDGNMMQKSLWTELAEIVIVRGSPLRFRYRLENSDEWRSFVYVVE